MSLLMVLCVASPSGTQSSLDGLEIMRKVDWLLHGDSKHGIIEMTVVRPNWQRTLRMEIWEKGREHSFVRIQSPLKEAGVGSLRIGAGMWNYLPSVEKVIKIAPSMMGQNWMGSDVTNDDMLKATSILHDYEHRVIGVEKVDRQQVYKIESLPKPEAPVVWGKLVFFVRTHDYVPIKQEYWGESNELVKTLIFEEIKEFNDRKFPTRWELRPVKVDKGFTVIKYEYIEFDIPIDERIFTLQNLKSVR